MDENYFITLSNFADLKKAESQCRDVYYKLQHDGYYSWCEDGSRMDDLRKAAMRALEDYADALNSEYSKTKDRLFDKLEDSDKVLNLKNLFK